VQQRTGSKLGEILIGMGVLKDEDLQVILSKQNNVQIVMSEAIAQKRRARG